VKFAGAVAAVVLGSLAVCPETGKRRDQHQAQEFFVQPGVLQRDVPRVGINLGHWTSWGAEQLMANVLKNPGFEGVVDGAMVIVREAEARAFVDDTDWVARTPGFWDGARFEILTGALQGRGGVVAVSRHQAGNTRFETVESVAGLAAGNAVAIRKVRDDEPPTQWWLEGSGMEADLTERRPGSPGRRSLRLAPRHGEASAVSYLDAIGARAGKLLPLSGGWRAGFWARGEGAALEVVVRRTGSPPLLRTEVRPDASWRYFELPLTAEDRGPAGTLELRFTVSAGARVWLDDACLSQVSPKTTAFRTEVVETLRHLRPGYLRDWQGQLGDSWANRLAGPQARRSWRYRPGPDATDFGYGLPEFLQLASEIGAQPWVVLPPVLSEAEWRHAGAYLSAAAQRYGFQEVLVEFGNENWNAIFRPAGLPDDRTLRASASNAFRSLDEGSRGDARIRPVLGGQFYNAPRALALTQDAGPRVLPAFAPYWAFELEGPGSLFPEEPAKRLAELNAVREVAVYEMNAHSLSSRLDVARENELLEGPVAGTALAWHALGALQAGVKRICVYTLAGFDTFGDRPGRLVRLFGVTRDLAQANRLRGSGEALAQLNAAVAGELHSVAGGGEVVRMAAFRKAGRWTVVAASRSPSPVLARVRFPDGALPLEFGLEAYGFVVVESRRSGDTH
jgi:hypothetical protein